VVKIPRALAAIPLLFCFALLAAACVGTENPSGWVAPVFDGQTVYFAEAHDHLAAAPAPGTDNQTTISWVFPAKNDPAQKGISLKGIYGRPVVDGANVYLSSYSGGVFALTKKDGHVVWQMKSEISGNVSGGVAVSSKLLAFGTTDGHLYVVNKSDHTTANNWPTSGLTVDGGIWAAPIFSADGQTLYVATMSGNLKAYNVADHSEAWTFHASGAIADMALLDSTHLFVPSLNHHAYVLDPTKQGKVTTDFAARDWIWTTPAYKDGIAYFGDFSGYVYALDLSGPAGHLKWESKVSTKGSRIFSAPALVGGLLVVADREPAVHFVDPATGQVKNTVPLLTSTVRADVTAEGNYAYVSTTNGHLFRADPSQLKVAEVTVGGRP